MISGKSHRPPLKSETSCRASRIAFVAVFDAAEVAAVILVFLEEGNEFEMPTMSMPQRRSSL